MPALKIIEGGGAPFSGAVVTPVPGGKVLTVGDGKGGIASLILSPDEAEALSEALRGE